MRQIGGGRSYPLFPVMVRIRVLSLPVWPMASARADFGLTLGKSRDHGAGRKGSAEPAIFQRTAFLVGADSKRPQTLAHRAGAIWLAALTYYRWGAMLRMQSFGVSPLASKITPHRGRPNRRPLCLDRTILQSPPSVKPPC